MEDDTQNNRILRKREVKVQYEENLLGTSTNKVIDTAEDETQFKKPIGRPLVNNKLWKQKPYNIPKETQIWNDEYMERISHKNRINRQQKHSESLMVLREKVFDKEKKYISQFLDEFPQLCGTKNKENTNVTENGMNDSLECAIKEKENEAYNSSRSTNITTPSSETVTVIKTNGLIDSKLKSVKTAADQNKILEELVENGNIYERLVTIENFSLCRNDLQTLMGKNWINDQIINAYMLLIEQRSKQQPNLPQVFALDTFIYQQLVHGEFEDALNWTQDVIIDKYDMLLLPLCVKQTHWCLIVIDVKYCLIVYYDSLENSSKDIFEILINYVNELQRQAGKDIHDFKTSVAYVPQQENFDDCGVFTCMFAEQVSRRLPISCVQEDMAEYRFKILKSLIANKII